MSDVTPPIDETAFVARVTELIGATNDRDARAAIRATLSALGEALEPSERGALSGALPPSMRKGLGVGGARAMDVAELVHTAQRREGVAPGFAREHAQVVCRVLAELLPPGVRSRVERELPEPLRALFRPPVAPDPPRPHRLAQRAERDTLATARPGSRHPLSEAAPPGAHAHSVVREDNPHADTKLSSAEGMTQERHGGSLATARPGTHRRIGEAGD